MKIFYIDTSSSYLYSGIVENSNLICEIKKNYGTCLSKYALFDISEMFKKYNIKPQEIDKIIVVSGPGSFTGIRIGMTFAKIFAWSLNKEIISITSLEAMATSYNGNLVTVPIIDARRGFFYAAVYKNDTEILNGQYIELIKLKDFLNKLNEECVFITNDTSLHFNNLLKYNPDILKIVKKYQTKKSINPHLIEPTYLKLTEAEENLGNNNYDN